MWRTNKTWPLLQPETGRERRTVGPVTEIGEREVLLLANLERKLDILRI
jgi:hypothetical protein